MDLGHHGWKTLIVAGISKPHKTATLLVLDPDHFATCGPTPALTDAITAREQELKRLNDQVLQPDGLTPTLDELRIFVTERLANITSLVNKDVERARNELRKHTPTITMTPTGDHYTASGKWDILGNQSTYGRGTRVWMVAGEGFEPSTFGL
jgi:hypothetical protein